MGWLSEQRGRGAVFHNVKGAPSQTPTSPASYLDHSVSGGDLPFSLPHLPLSHNPLNPLTIGLYYCQLCGANIANGQAVFSVLHQHKN